MKKKQRRLFYLLIVLAVATIIGMLMLIISQRDWSDAVFDLIILITGAASILLAVYSERTATQENARLSKMVRELSNIDANVSADKQTDEEIRKKLNKIIAMDEEILADLEKGKKTKTKGKKQ